MEIVKHIKVKQTCTNCKKKITSQFLILSIPRDFKTSDISKQVLENLPTSVCLQHPTALKHTSYTYYHEEILS